MLRQTDGQTPYHFIDPAPHTKQAVPKSSYSSRLYTQCTQRGCSRRLCRRPRRRVVYSEVLCIALQFLQRSFLLVNRFHVVADCSVNDVGGRSLQKSVPEHVLSTINHLTYTEVTFHYYWPFILMPVRNFDDVVGTSEVLTTVDLKSVCINWLPRLFWQQFSRREVLRHKCLYILAASVSN